MSDRELDVIAGWVALGIMVFILVVTPILMLLEDAKWRPMGKLLDWLHNR